MHLFTFTVLYILLLVMLLVSRVLSFVYNSRALKKDLRRQLIPQGRLHEGYRPRYVAGGALFLPSLFFLPAAAAAALLLFFVIAAATTTASAAS